MYIDQFISGQKSGNISKKDLTPNHQKTNCQHREMMHMIGTINTNTPNNTAATGATYSNYASEGASVNFNPCSTP